MGMTFMVAIVYAWDCDMAFLTVFFYGFLPAKFTAALTEAEKDTIFGLPRSDP
jgi:hypothetical protein